MPPQAHDEYARFARLYEPILGPLLAELRLETASLALALRARTVLDICCGTGAQLAMLHRAGLACTGVDLSAPMLAVARANTPRDIRYLRADADALPLADQRFDLAVITFALHEKPQPVRLAMLAEALRVLRPGGTLAIADYTTPATPRARLALAAATAVERMAGTPHYTLFREFMQNGATPGLLKAADLPHHQHAPTHSGAVTLTVVPAA